MSTTSHRHSKDRLGRLESAEWQNLARPMVYPDPPERLDSRNMSGLTCAYGGAGRRCRSRLLNWCAAVSEIGSLFVIEVVSWGIGGTGAAVRALGNLI